MLNVNNIIWLLLNPTIEINMPEFCHKMGINQPRDSAGKCMEVRMCYLHIYHPVFFKFCTVALGDFGLSNKCK